MWQFIVMLVVGLWSLAPIPSCHLVLLSNSRRQFQVSCPPRCNTTTASCCILIFNAASLQCCQLSCLYPSPLATVVYYAPCSLATVLGDLSLLLPVITVSGWLSYPQLRGNSGIQVGSFIPNSVTTVAARLVILPPGP